MRIDLTGATGFVGRAVARRLRDDGHTVVALLLPGEPVPPGLADVVRGDITDPTSLRGHLDGCDGVVHLAGAVGYGQKWEVCEALNVSGTAHVVAEAERAGVRRFVHMSSVSVYGRVSGITLDEDAPMLKIGDPYGDTKIDAEGVVRAASAAGALDLTVLRPTVIYGPGDRLFLPKVVDNLRSGRARVIGKGEHPIDLVHVDDVASFVALVFTEAATIGHAFNVNHPANPSWREFLGLVANAVGTKPPRRRLPYPAAFAAASLMELASRATGRPPRLTRYAVRVIGRPYHYDTRRALELGWSPQIDVAEGLRRFTQGSGRS